MLPGLPLYPLLIKSAEHFTLPQKSRMQKEKNTFLAFEFQNACPIGVGRAATVVALGKGWVVGVPIPPPPTER